MAPREFLYDTAADAIRKQIAAGELKPGDKIGQSIPEMAKAYGIGEGTMRRVLQLLAADGLVETQQGKGSTVTGTAAEADAARVDAQALAREFAEMRETVRRLEGDFADLKADHGRTKAQVAELKSRRNIDGAARKQVRSHEQSS